MSNENDAGRGKFPWVTMNPERNAGGYGFGLPKKEEMVSSLRAIADQIESGEANAQVFEIAKATAEDDFSFDRLNLIVARKIVDVPTAPSGS